MKPSQLLAAVLAVASVSAAWPDVLDDAKAVGEVRNVLYGRQDDGDTSRAESSSRPTQTNNDEEPSATEEAPESSAKESSARETGKASATGDNEDAKTTEKPTGTAKASGSNRVTTGKKSVTAFDPRLPAGGISMVTPAPISGVQYYKIGDWVTFAWNYTSLSVTPSAIDILATCTANQATYTLAVNQSVEETGVILWDTKKYQASATVPLLTETYTLMIYDSESSVSATAKAGYLGVFNQFTFGMYVPRQPTPWAEWRAQCATCRNAAGSLSESLTIKVLLITCGTTIGSFLYFAHSFGLL